MSGDPSSGDPPMDDVPGPGFDTGDAHAHMDPETVLANTSVVVASNRRQNYTARSAPDWLEVIVRQDDGRNRARNRGVERANGEWIVVADDDITFPTKLTSILVDGMKQHHLVGLEDFWPMRWLLTRYMVFHRSLWEGVDGFDEGREHGGDTDFCMKCEKYGAKLCPLPRRTVPHHDVDTTFDTERHLEWLSYLFRRHPGKTAVPAAKLALARFGLVADYADR